MSTSVEFYLNFLRADITPSTLEKRKISISFDNLSLLKNDIFYSNFY